MKSSIIVIFFCLFIGSTARSSKCPTPQWFVAEFTCIADKVISPPMVLRDSDLTFFRNVMLYSEKEIAQVEEAAIQFFNTRFGLNFSQSEPDEHRQRYYENATFLPTRFNPELQYVATFNRWIVSGNTRSVCFENRPGAFTARFSGEQILHGTYGGEKGIPVASTDSVVYGFFNIPVCPQEPLVIQFRTATPIRIEPHDGFHIINIDLFHPIWGHGLNQGIAQIIPTEDGHIHVTTRETFTFPAHPTFVP